MNLIGSALRLGPRLSAGARRIALLELLPARERRVNAAAALADPTLLRAPPDARNTILASETHRWIHSIPSSLHPKQLCRNHPHLANRLALCWGDALRVQAFIDDVLIDKRGNRQGVSERVRTELLRLKKFHDREMRASWWPWRASTRRRLSVADYPIQRRKRA